MGLMTFDTAVRAAHELLEVNVPVRIAADRDGASLEITAVELSLPRLTLIAELAHRHELVLVHLAGERLRLVG